MDIKVSYSDDDVNTIMLAHHKQTFGNPPHGTEWISSVDYNGRTVTTRALPTEEFKLDETKPVPEV